MGHLKSRKSIECRLNWNTAEIKLMIKNAGYLHKSFLFFRYNPPCDGMQVLSNYIYLFRRKKNPNHKYSFRLEIKFLTNKFEEIVSNREYGMDNLWAEIGGYVGIFLGYSLIQVFDCFKTMVDWIITRVWFGRTKGGKSFWVGDLNITFIRFNLTLSNYCKLNPILQGEGSTFYYSFISSSKSLKFI